jgi:O-antigen ligase
LRLKKNNFFYFFLVLFFLISLIIGERSNFLKIFIIYILLVLTINNILYIRKVLLLIFIFGISVFVIYQNDGLKSKYIKHIFGKKYEIIQENKINKNKVFDFIKSNRHINHYLIAIEIFKKNLFFGSGFRTYRYESFKDENNKYLEKSAGSTHPHQIHFEFLSDLGIVGYSLILLNIIKLLLDQRKLKLNVFRYGSILFIISYMIPLIPSGSFFSTFYATIFWINYSFLIRNKN